MNKEAQAVFLEYFCKGLQKEANLSVSESIGVAIWFADQKYLLTKKAADPVTPPPATTTPPPRQSGWDKDKAWLKGVVQDFKDNGFVKPVQDFWGGVEKRIGQAGADRVMNQSGISGVGNILERIAPYAVPGIIGYLGLKAMGAEGGTAALGGLAAGALGGSLWNDPGMLDKAPAPAGTATPAAEAEAIPAAGTPPPPTTTSSSSNGVDSTRAIAEREVDRQLRRPTSRSEYA